LVAYLTTYHAEVDRDGAVWRIRVPEVRRTTQARSLREVRAMARDLIAIMDNIPADSFDLDITITLPADVEDLVEALQARGARSLSAAANDALREAIAEDAHRAALLAWLDELDAARGAPSAEQLAAADALLDAIERITRRPDARM
jgi:Arc/MetJ-type ribon-helix-helix transcriptional regulator